jgi:hypothetical protein
MAIKYFQWLKNRPNGHKIYQDFPWQDPPKFTQIEIFGLKTNHLATLHWGLWRVRKRVNPALAAWCILRLRS